MNKPDISEALKKVSDALSQGRCVQVRGPLGSGRNTLATALQQQRAAAFVELLDVQEIDSTAAAWIQAGSHVSASDRPSLEGGSAEALRLYISKIAKALSGSKVLLLYIPPSWTQMSGFEIDNDRRERLAAVLRGFRSVRRRVEFLGSRRRSEFMWGEGPDESTPGSSLVEEVQLSPYAVEIQSVWDTELTSVAQAHVFMAFTEKQPAFCFGVASFKGVGKAFERPVDIVADPLTGDRRPGREGHSLVEGLKRPGGCPKKRHKDFLLNLVNLCSPHDDGSYL